jgi:hypothetical protein
MSNAQSKMTMTTRPNASFVIGRNALGKWYADFGDKFPRTQKYAQETMVNEIGDWTPEIIATVIVESSKIVLNIEAGKYDKCRIPNTESICSQNEFIDGLVFNYLKHAVKWINQMSNACPDTVVGKWDLILEAFPEQKSFDAHQFVVMALNRYGRTSA